MAYFALVSPYTIKLRYNKSEYLSQPELFSLLLLYLFYLSLLLKFDMIL